MFPSGLIVSFFLREEGLKKKNQVLVSASDLASFSWDNQQIFLAVLNDPINERDVLKEGAKDTTFLRWTATSKEAKRLKPENWQESRGPTLQIKHNSHSCQAIPNYSWCQTHISFLVMSLDPQPEGWGACICKNWQSECLRLAESQATLLRTENETNKKYF